MARRKTKKRKHHGRRRRGHRMHGVHPALAQTAAMILGAGVGAIAGAFANQSIKTSFTTAPAYVGGAVDVAAGAAIVAFAPPSPFMTGLGAGLMGIGAVFATNETFLSLPGISGMPFGVPNAGPGYLNRTVADYRGIPANRVGNLSGSNGQVVAGLYRN